MSKTSNILGQITEVLRDSFDLDDVNLTKPEGTVMSKPSIDVMFDVYVGHGICPDKETNETCKHIEIKSQLRALIEEALNELVGEDEKHQNGKPIVKPWACDDCGMDDGAYTRNLFRAEQRQNIPAILDKLFKGEI